MSSFSYVELRVVKHSANCCIDSGIPLETHLTSFVSFDRFDRAFTLRDIYRLHNSFPIHLHCSLLLDFLRSQVFNRLETIFPSINSPIASFLFSHTLFPVELFHPEIEFLP